MKHLRAGVFVSRSMVSSSATEYTTNWSWLVAPLQGPSPHTADSVLHTKVLVHHASRGEPVPNLQRRIGSQGSCGAAQRPGKIFLLLECHLQSSQCTKPQQQKLQRTTRLWVVPGPKSPNFTSWSETLHLQEGVRVTKQSANSIRIEHGATFAKKKSKFGHAVYTMIQPSTLKNFIPCL